MIQLQKDYTTPEQSKKLLTLGFPADSANMYYRPQILTPYAFNEGMTFSRYSKVEEILPCWSVGQLIEIARTCLEERRFKVFIALMIWKNPIVQLMKLYEAFGKEVNFSKLED